MGSVLLLARDPAITTSVRRMLERSESLTLAAEVASLGEVSATVVDAAIEGLVVECRDHSALRTAILVAGEGRPLGVLAVVPDAALLEVAGKFAPSLVHAVTRDDLLDLDDVGRTALVTVLARLCRGPNKRRMKTTMSDTRVGEVAERLLRSAEDSGPPDSRPPDPG